MAYEDLDDYSVGAAGSDTFDIVIPDLDPNTAYPIQFRWQFADKTVGEWSVSKLLNTPEIARPESTNIVAQWITLDSGDALQITWDAPLLANGFVVYLTSGLTTVPFGHTLDKNKTEQKLIITAQDIRGSFAGVFETNLTGLLKTTYIDTSTLGSSFTIPAFIDSLNGAAIADSAWLITSIDKGISVSWNAISTSGTYWETVVYKSSTQNGTYVAVGSARNAPVMIEEINTVWIKIRHRLTTGGFSAYSNPKEAKAYVPIVFDETPPNEVTVNSAAWSGNDLLINYTMPATDPGTRFKVTLTTGIYTGYFYDYFPATSGTFTYKITNDLIFKQLSSNQATSYTGKFISIDAADNPTSGTNFSTGTLSNPGVGETPTFILTGITNGYTATWTAPSWSTYTKVWEGTVSGFTPNDATNLVYSGSSPAIIKTLGRSDPYGRKYIKIKNFGPIAGQQSEFFSAEQFVDPIDALTADISAPDAPSTGGSFAASAAIDTNGTMGFNGYVNLVWNAVSDSTLRGYRIRFRPYKASAPFENYSYVNSPGTGTSYRLAGLAVGAVYEIAVATYDEYNNTSSYTSYSNQTVSGVPAISNYITAGAAGFQFGSGIKDKTGSQNTSAQGLYLNNSNYWYLTAADAAQFKIGGAASNYVEWDGALLKVDGDLGVAGGTTIGGNISMKNSGASIYAGTLSGAGALNSDGFMLNYGGLAARKTFTVGGQSVTKEVRLQTGDGIYADYGQIAGWTIDTDRIERGTGATGNLYAGLSSTGTYSFWAGSTGSKGNSSANFLVTPGGAVTARNLSIFGTGSDTAKLIDAGSNFYVRQDGFIYATNAEIQGTISASAGTFKGVVDIGTASIPAGQLRVASTGGTILIGHGLTMDGAAAAGITATNTGGTQNFWVRATDGYLFSQSGKIGGWSIGTSKLSGGGGSSAVGLQIDSTAGGYAFWAGAGTPDTSTPFSVTNTGILRATGAIISGAITVTSGRIGSQTQGWDIKGATLESFGTPDGTNKVILNSTTGEISGAKISSTKFIGSAFYIGTSESSTDKILSNGTFSLGNGTMTYSGSGDITLNGSSLTFTGATNAIFGDDNGYGGDSTVVLNQNAQLTKGRAFHYGGTTIPTSSNTSRQVYNTKKSAAQGTNVFDTVSFTAGDLWMTVD
jgi:hypothetical protein